jgi:hypothetical protein
MFLRVQMIVLTALAAVVVSALFVSVGTPARPADAALEEGTFRADVLIGNDDDNMANPVIQPATELVNQSLDNSDILTGSGGNDVLIGLQGADTLLGGLGNDILVGGPEGGSTFPKTDLQFGDGGDDVALWAPGDGNDAFVGGTGKDALVFGVTDRQAGVPTLTGVARGFPQGIPTANVSGQNGFCSLERVTSSTGLGYEWLVRFRNKATGAFIVTVRVSGVEQVYCTSQTAAAITFADLTAAEPQFVEVSTAQVRVLNEIVGGMIR